MRTQLVTAAIRLLTEGGPEALRSRKLASAVGASTMAVYTHFGGMTQLLDAVADEGFRRLSAELAIAPRTGDEVADLFLLGYAYRNAAIANPNLYAVTFGQVSPGGFRAVVRDITVEKIRAEPDEGIRAFRFLLDAADAAINAGRFHPGEPFIAAAQLWSGLHGYVTLEMAGTFGTDGHAMTQILGPLTRTLAIGLGDTPEAATESLRIAEEARPANS
jgi:AcrR family transcriptional regulator